MIAGQSPNLLGAIVFTLLIVSATGVAIGVLYMSPRIVVSGAKLLLHFAHDAIVGISHSVQVLRHRH